ncbi:MAG: hypothetical protein KAT93_08620, partial [Desulfuromonadales bacterium]|nr:hypothetical protein [Desulfuromonadales bacterium]
MDRKSNLWLIAAILLFCMASLNVVDVSGSMIALPADCKVKARWVCPPFDREKVEHADWEQDDWFRFDFWRSKFNFTVDASGQPWFAIPGQLGIKGLVLNPIKQYRFGLSHPFKGMVCLDNGAWLFHTDHDLGFISAPDTLPVEDGNAVVPFQPAVTLPLPDCRVYAGANSALYLVGTADHGVQEVYLLQPEALSQGQQRILRSFRKVFASEAPIGAVTGDGQTTFVALGRTIVRITHEGQTESDMLVHPSDTIKQLAYSPTAGLFYTTDQAVGFVGQHGAWDFLPLYWFSYFKAQIALRGESLYVCLPGTWGVFALDNISDLAKYAPNGVYIPHAQPSQPVEVTDIQFRAQPVDPNGKMFYGTEFERSSISQVCGIVSLHPKSEQAINTVLTVLWDGPKDLREDGCMRGGRTSTRVLRFGEGKDQQWQFCPTYMFYPGEYSMKVLLDGVEAKTGHFKVTGKTTVKEAALQDNIPLLETLLE